MSLPSDSIALQIHIRPMQEADLPQVLEIDRRSFSIPWPERAFHYELFENPGSMLWVAETPVSEEAHKIIGMIVVWLIIDEAHIATIAVCPEYRRQGVASRLLTEALKKVIQQGFTVATLEVRAHNHAAQNLYARFGFRVVGTRPRYYQDNHEDAWIMTNDHLNQALLERLERTAWE